MTVEQSAVEAVVKIRTRRRDWMRWFPFAGFQLALAVGWMWLNQPYFALVWLAFSCASVAEALWLKAVGVDLTGESADVRGLRRRQVPWAEVQTVVQHRRFGSWSVRLILMSGEVVTLRAPTTGWGSGGAEYERDFHRIGKWWLAHRGESWRPVRKEEPQPPAQRERD
jgi:hypothetical protein